MKRPFQWDLPEWAEVLYRHSSGNNCSIDQKMLVILRTFIQINEYKMEPMSVLAVIHHIAKQWCWGSAGIESVAPWVCCKASAKVWHLVKCWKLMEKYCCINQCFKKYPSGREHGRWVLLEIHFTKITNTWDQKNKFRTNGNKNVLFREEIHDDSAFKSRTTTRVNKPVFVYPLTGTDGKGKCILLSHRVAGT